MENILEKTVKALGNIDVNELSVKQVIALLNMWDSNYAKAENASFTQMLKRCYKSHPWHENSSIIYLHKDNNKTTIVHNGCYDLDEGETELIFNLLKKQLR